MGPCPTPPPHPKKKKKKREGERKRGERREGEENEIHVTGKTWETGARGYIVSVISNPQVISISNFTPLPFFIFYSMDL